MWKEGNVMRDFSEIAKELRLSKNLTQTQLAERMWVKKSIMKQTRALRALICLLSTQRNLMSPPIIY